jgi:hypothetical protein
MKKLLTILLLICSLTASATKYYCAPSTATPAGSDANAGTIAAPFFTLEKAWTVIGAGDTVYMRGGTYNYTESQDLTGVNGSAGSVIKIYAYPNEVPSITKFGAFTWNAWWAGIQFTGNYFHWKGIEMTGFTQEANHPYFSFYAINCSNCTFELMNLHHGMIGMYLREYSGGTSTGNLILNCDFHHNYDPLTGGDGPYTNADGLDVAEILNTTSVNTIQGCRAWANSDDGIDLWNNEGLVYIVNTWSFDNGWREDGVTHGGDGNGFKLGDQTVADSTMLGRVITGCASWNNWNSGIEQNGANCYMHIYNNVMYNTHLGMFFTTTYGDSPSVFRNNICYANVHANFASDLTLATIDHNSWQDGLTVNDADFASVDSTGCSGTRGSTGSLPNINFLHLVEGSDLIDAGTDVVTHDAVGHHKYGAAWDIGAYEWGQWYLMNSGKLEMDNGKIVVIKR